ncbi:MAG: tRNA uridine-5-carboxymethylaminomethyl(34) synthesis GTPase MnmE [Euryarchaeota archaeon]|nr:tRNA uridine-5-carboxymethylaminomethyl(34) synthesis GTPase MnmE [Euryarchaeota archaeon]
MYNTSDNIVALATIPGKSALNVVRCSGLNSLLLYKKMFNQTKTPSPNFLHRRSAYFNKQIVDDCMVVFFKGPKSYTGEDMLEISTHGGTVIVKKIIECIENHSFRQAFPGEFTYRAFINGKIDLMQAESIQSAVDSGNNLDALYSINNIKGSLSRKTSAATLEIQNILTHMEHELDFNEGEIDFKSQKEYIKNIKKTISSIKKIISYSYLASEKKSSLVIVLAGKTNVGKSSLFNSLLGRERSIVTNKKGTTRDTIEVEIVINKINVELVDTAGIRKTKEIVERKGVSRTYRAIKKADIVLFVDSRSPQKSFANFKVLLKDKKIIFINSKSDLKTHSKEKGSYSLSSKTGEGFDAVYKTIKEEVDVYLKNFIDNNLFLINSRQKKILEQAASLLEKTIVSYESTNDLAVAASFLRESFNMFKELQGYNNKNEIINNIFKGFCVGK